MRTSARLFGLLLVLSHAATFAHAQNRLEADGKQAVSSSVPIVRVTVENPREINLGKPASFVVSVTNQGKVRASNVVVETEIPAHAELSRTIPEPIELKKGVARFQIGDLAPGITRQISLIAVPRTKQPIKLAATTTFSSATHSTLLVRQPMLKLLAQVPSSIEIGKEVDWVLRVTNTGDGRADDVVITPRLLAGEVQGSPLRHALKIGSLKAGEAKEVQFSVVPTRRGKLSATFEGSNADGLKATTESTFQVLQAGLAVTATGPAVQPLAREGTYEIQVTNPGDATTGSAMVVVQVPSGLNVTAAAENSYDDSTRTLRWRITKVRPSDVVRLPFRAESTAAGDQTLRVVAQCRNIKEATTEHTTAVISRSNLIVTVVNDQELAEVADPVGFKVAVVNAGSKPVKDLRVSVAMPDGLAAIDSSKYQVADGRILFPMQQLASGEKVTLAFTAIGKRVGEHRVRVLVRGGTLTRELSFEGSTYCYSNETVPVSQQRSGEDAAPTAGSQPATGTPAPRPQTGELPSFIN